jgi:hypothetical protein
MGNIVKASEQVKMVRSNTSVAHHRFFNTMMLAIKQKIEEQNPELKLQFGGKEVSGSNISASLRGQMIDTDGDADDKVRQTMDTLKNPSSLLSLLE